jgi:hypothetical protein
VPIQGRLNLLALLVSVSIGSMFCLHFGLLRSDGSPLTSRVLLVGLRRIVLEKLGHSLLPVRVFLSGSFLRSMVLLASPRQISCFLAGSYSFNTSARQDRTCLLPPRRKVLEQFLRSFVEPFLVLLLFFAGFKRMLGSTYPNELLCSRVIHTEDESPDVNS